jgi:hypothetical protein
MINETDSDTSVKDDVETAMDLDIPLTPISAPNSPRPEPTRYGDWEKAGRCIDF